MQEISFKRTCSQQVSVNSRLKVIQIIGQRKAFYRQRIPESSCARKETVDIGILVTSRNGDRKIMQSIRRMSRPSSRKRKWNQLIQFKRTSTKVIPRLALATFFAKMNYVFTHDKDKSNMIWCFQKLTSLQFILQGVWVIRPPALGTHKTLTSLN